MRRVRPVGVIPFGRDALVRKRTAYAVDDRCPHMSAPLSIGSLEDCVVSCPLHDGRFDLASGDVERMPTTGGLLPDGTYVVTVVIPSHDCGQRTESGTQSKAAALAVASR